MSMGDVVPFRKRNEPTPRAEVRVDVDGDGVPDLVTPSTATDGAPQVVRTTVSVREQDMRPVIPAWLRSAEGRRATAHRALRIAWHRCAFHGARIPVYVPLLSWRALRGAGVVVVWLVRWVLDTRADALEQQLATGTRADTKLFIEHRKERARRIKARLGVAGVVLGAAWILTALTARYVPAAGWAALLVASVAGLVRAGTPQGRSVLAPAMLGSRPYREITDAIVMRALGAAKLAGDAPRYDRDGNVTQEGNLATLAGPIARSANGRGTEILVDLPFGATAGDAAARIDRLASGFDVEESQVFATPVPGSTRRVQIYVADEDPMLLAPHRSPLARLPKVSVWDPHPIARTPLGRIVAATLLFSSFLVGAVPRSGKSFAAKCLVVPAVLDPDCDVTVIDCGGGRDWLPTAQVAVNYISGDEDDDLVKAVAVLEQLQAEARARLARFRKLSTAECPEDKLTRELAAGGLRPHVIVVDEIQNLIKADNKQVAKAALRLLIWLVKVAPKAGFVAVLITQRPGADVIPSDLRDNTTIRLALRTKTPQSSDAILGAYISAKGFRSDRFLENHKGACVVGGISTGAGGDLQYARTDLLMPADFEKACAVGRQRRIDAGTLRGEAAGEAQQITVTVTVVDDVAAVWPGEEPKVQAHLLVDRLREVYGDRYAGLDETGLTRALKGHGVRALQVFREGTNRNGYALTEVRKACRAIEAD